MSAGSEVFLDGPTKWAAWLQAVRARSGDFWVCWDPMVDAEERVPVPSRPVMPAAIEPVTMGDVKYATVEEMESRSKRVAAENRERQAAYEMAAIRYTMLMTEYTYFTSYRTNVLKFINSSVAAQYCREMSEAFGLDVAKQLAFLRVEFEEIIDLSSIPRVINQFFEIHRNLPSRASLKTWVAEWETMIAECVRLGSLQDIIGFSMVSLRHLADHLGFELVRMKMDLSEDASTLANIRKWMKIIVQENDDMFAFEEEPGSASIAGSGHAGSNDGRQHDGNNGVSNGHARKRRRGQYQS